eukprot:913959-Rhodomonas_salina.4
MPKLRAMLRTLFVDCNSFHNVDQHIGQSRCLPTHTRDCVRRPVLTKRMCYQISRTDKAYVLPDASACATRSLVLTQRRCYRSLVLTKRIGYQIPRTNSAYALLDPWYELIVCATRPLALDLPRRSCPRRSRAGRAARRSASVYAGRPAVYGGKPGSFALKVMPFMEAMRPLVPCLRCCWSC